MCANAIQDIHLTKTALVVMVRDVSGGTSVFDQSLDFSTLFVNAQLCNRNSVFLHLDMPYRANFDSFISLNKTKL